jgi:hypothetical protein
MGRPLPKRFFGYENTGDTGNTKDNYTKGGYDGVAGKGFLGIDFSNDRGHFTTAPSGLVVPTPTDTAGKAATFNSIMIEVQSVSTSAGHTGLVVGDTYTYAGCGTGFLVTVATVPGSGNATFTLTNPGAGIPINSIPHSGNTQNVTLTKVSGSGVSTFAADIYWHIGLGSQTFLSTSDDGEGYTGLETISITGSGAPTNYVLSYTTPSGTPYTQDSFTGILVNANTTGSGSKVGTIRRQRSTHLYYVSTSDGSAVCQLQGAAASTTGQMTITATDSSGKTYYVTKLTRHLATLSQYGSSGWQFATGTRVQWVTGPATHGTTVQIANA